MKITDFKNRRTFLKNTTVAPIVAEAVGASPVAKNEGVNAESLTTQSLHGLEALRRLNSNDRSHRPQ
jgi:hypothetical protein